SRPTSPPPRPRAIAPARAGSSSPSTSRTWCGATRCRGRTGCRRWRSARSPASPPAMAPRAGRPPWTAARRPSSARTGAPGPGRVWRAGAWWRRGVRRGAGLPPPARAPVAVFGLSFLARAQLEALTDLAATTDVTVYVLDPCEELWDDVAGRRAAAMIDPTG